MKKNLLSAVTIFYILLPIFIFLYGWLKLPVAIVSILILVGYTSDIFLSVYRCHSGRKCSFKKNLTRHISSKTLFGISLVFLFIMFWLAFSGAGGAGFQNDDYVAHNALLKDLIIQDWPLTSMLDNTRVHIVYYVAYYLPAAAIGKVFGWVIANIVLFIWTLIGVILAFFWFWGVSRVEAKNRATKLVQLATIFCLAGGLDYIGYYLLNHHAFSITNHIEHWADYFQYSSNTTLIYWVPQHTIASWLIIGMIVDALYNKQNLQYLGMPVAAGILWSPFGMIGILPYLMTLTFVYLQAEYRRYLFNRKSILFNGLSFGFSSIYLLYLGSNRFEFPVGIIWQFSDDLVSLAKHLVAFCFFEFALLAFITLLFIFVGVLSSRLIHVNLTWRKLITLLEREFGITPIQLGLFIICLGVLGLLPFFKMGINNDLVMRGSIPSLFIFWAFTTKVVSNASLRARWKFNLMYMFILLIVIIGFFPSFAEIERSAQAYHLGPPPFAEVQTTLDINEIQYTMQRIGSEDTFFFRYMAK